MYKQEKLSPTSSKNWIIVFILLLGLMVTTVSINAQTIVKKATFNPESTESHVIEYFKVKSANNKLYFKFLVIENSPETTYTLESSSNGTDFYAVQLKEGFKSPNGVALLYCYSVNLNQLNDNVYRVRRDSPDGINYSSTIEMNNTIDQNLSAKNN